jgi:hypothetical protein
MSTDDPIVHMTRINVSKITEYVPIEKQYLLDAQKYIERAQKYLDEGKAAHATGCLAKAAKKLHRHNELCRIFNDGYIGLVITPIMNKLSEQIAKNILG